MLSDSLLPCSSVKFLTNITFKRIFTLCHPGLLTAVNCSNVKIAAKVTEVVSVTKVLALVMIIIAGAIHLFTGHTDNLAWDSLVQDTTTSPGRIALSFYSGLFSFAGWNYLNFVTEELQEKQKSSESHIHFSSPSYHHLPAGQCSLLCRPVLHGDPLLQRRGGHLRQQDVRCDAVDHSLLVACSTFGAVNSGIFASSRLFFVGARNGHFPRSMALINIKHLTPIPCLILLGVITLLLLTTSDVFILINFTSFVESLFIMISVFSVLYLRWIEPDLVRPIRVNIIFPILFFVICGFLVLMPVFEEPEVVGVGCLIIVSGIPVYFIFIRLRSKMTCLNRITNTIDSSLQKFFYAMPDMEHED